MNRIYGLTIEGTDDTDDGVGINLPKLLTVLGELPVKPILRICLEFGVDPKAYGHYVSALKLAGYQIMLQPVDSQDMEHYTITGYETRFRESLFALGSYTDYVECANEINGDWCGEHAYEKMEAALKLVGRRFERVVTLYVTDGFESYVTPDEIDYLFYSVYPMSESVAARFTADQMAKSHIVGIGEYGSENADGELGPFGAKAKLIQDFETMPTSGNNIHGGFYWDFYDDCVKNDTGILDVFKTVWK